MVTSKRNSLRLVMVSIGLLAITAFIVWDRAGAIRVSESLPKPVRDPNPITEITDSFAVKGIPFSGEAAPRTIKNERQFELTVEVVSETGTRLSGATVEVQHAGSWSVSRTDPEGRSTLSLPGQGSVVVVAKAVGFAPSRIDEFVDIRASTFVRITLTPSCVLVVKVLATLSGPLPPVTVSLKPIELQHELIGGDTVGEQWSPSQSVDAIGEARFESLHPGMYVVQTSSPVLVPSKSRVVVRDGQPNYFEVALVAGALLKLQFIHDGSGEAWPHAAVQTVFTGPIPSAEIRILQNADGVGVLTIARPADMVCHIGSVSTSDCFFDAITISPEVSEVTIRCSAPRDLRCRVKRTDGSIVLDATVEVRYATGRVVKSPSIADQDSYFHVPASCGWGIGDFRFLTTDGEVSAWRRCYLNNDHPWILDVTVRSSVGLQLTVTDDKGVQINGARVSVSAPTNMKRAALGSTTRTPPEAIAETDLNGSALLQLCRAAMYQIVVEKGGYGEECRLVWTASRSDYPAAAIGTDFASFRTFESGAVLNFGNIILHRAGTLTASIIGLEPGSRRSVYLKSMAVGTGARDVWRTTRLDGTAVFESITTGNYQVYLQDVGAFVNHNPFIRPALDAPVMIEAGVDSSIKINAR